MNRLRTLFLSFLALTSFAFAKAQIGNPYLRVFVNETFSTPVHAWTLSKVEYFKDCTMCYFMVKSTEANVYLRLLPGCYIMDNLGNKYNLIGSDLTSKSPGKKFSVAGEPLIFYMKFPALQYGAIKMSLILPELKVFDNILVGDGTTVTHTFSSGVKSPRANLWITEIKITDAKTTVTFVYDNTKSGSPGYWDWASINKNSKLVADGVSYPLLLGQNKSWQFTRQAKFTFTCDFEPIPKITRQIDFIETPSSSFNITGITVTPGSKP